MQAARKTPEQVGGVAPAKRDEACPWPQHLLAVGKFLPSRTHQARAITWRLHTPSCPKGLQSELKTGMIWDTKHATWSSFKYNFHLVLLSSTQFPTAGAATQQNLPVPVADLHGNQVLNHGLGVLRKASNKHAARQGAQSVRTQEQD